MCVYMCIWTSVYVYVYVQMIIVYMLWRENNPNYGIEVSPLRDLVPATVTALILKVY